MRRIAIAAGKGGAGKTTLAVNLAAGFALGGARVLLVDLDPFAPATASLGLAPEPGTSAGVILSGSPIAEALRPSSVDGLSVLPAGDGLGEAERKLRDHPGRLRDVFSPVRGFDFILFDAPPTLGSLSVAAIAAAKEVLVPVQATFLDARALPGTLSALAAIRRDLAPELRLRGIVPSRVTLTTLARDVIEVLRRDFPETTRTTIRHSIRLAEAPSFGLPIQLYDPSGGAAEDFNALTKEIRKE